MALNLNRVEVIGNLTRDPELNYTPNGQPLAKFAVATNRRYQDKAGNWVDMEPEYHETVVWGKLAEGVNKALKKGDRVYVTGRLQTRSWEGQDGAKRSRTELVADTIIGPDQVNRASYDAAGPMMNQPAPATAPATAAAPATTTPAPTAATAPTATPAPAASADDEINIEDIPF